MCTQIVKIRCVRTEKPSQNTLMYKTAHTHWEEDTTQLSSTSPSFPLPKEHGQIKNMYFLDTSFLGGGLFGNVKERIQKKKKI